MHKEIVHIVSCRFLVGFGAESGHAFMMNINSKWIDSIHEYVDSKVVLEFINSVRIIKVVLHHPSAYSLILWNVLNCIYDGIEVTG